MAKKVLMVVSSIMIGCILLTMFAGCAKTPEEEFQLLRQNVTYVLTESWYILCYHSDELLEKKGIKIKDSFVSGYFSDGIPVVRYYAFYEEAGEEKVKVFEIQSEYENLLVSCVNEGIEVIKIAEDELFYVPDYLREVEYNLVDGQIILS